MVTMAVSDPPPPHMVTPPCVQLRPSAVTDGALGVWSVHAIAAKKRFGPYAGEVVMEEDVDDKVDFRFAWEVINKETGKLMHVVNATKPEVGNWMRYVNCARFFEEQNIVSVQDGAEVFYEALKDIKPGEELLTWFDPPISRRSRKRRRAGRSVSTPDGDFTPPAAVRQPSSEDAEPSRNGKRRRKKKVDSDMLSLDDDDVLFASSGAHHNRIRMGASSGLRRSSSLPDGKMLPHRKSAALETPRTKTAADVSQSRSASEEKGQKTFASSCQQTNTLFSGPQPSSFAGIQHIPQSKSAHKGAHPKKSISEIVASITAKREAELKHEMMGSESNDSTSMSSTDASRSSSSKSRRHSIVGKAEDMQDASSEFQFLFEIMPVHKVIVRDGKKHVRYVCDACECKYHQAVNLKRHYLRTHVNHKYLSQDDINLCRNIIEAPSASVEADIDPDADEPEASASSSLSDVSASDVKIKTEPGEKEEEEQTASVVSVKAEADETAGVPIKKSKKAERLAKEALLKSKAEPGKMTFSYDGIDGVEDAFRCFLCVQLFPSITRLKHHVEYDAHRSRGDKQFGCERCNQRFRFQHNYLRHVESHGTNFGAFSTACHICGKKFLNEANMRKHLRFHSGRNFPCKYGCVDVVYPNVAELVKHLRAVHPNLPKKSEMTHLGRSSPVGSLSAGGDEQPRKKRGRPKLLVRKKVDNPVPMEPSPELDPDDLDAQEREAWLQSRPEGWVETRGRKPRPGVVGVHCTICKKKFSTYGSMCRHRRSVHRVVKQSSSASVKSEPSPPPTPTEPETSNDIPHEEMVIRHIEATIEQEYRKIDELMEQSRLEEQELEFGFSPPPSPTSFYANVADNIAENLSCYLDGGEVALQNARKHIQVDDYVPLSERPEYREEERVEWTEYNFPPFFMPVDPVIPHPPTPPVQPDTKLSLLMEGERTAAYPTRAVVASESRRASVGQEQGESQAAQPDTKASASREDCKAPSASNGKPLQVTESESVSNPEPTSATSRESSQDSQLVSAAATAGKDDIDTRSRDSVFSQEECPDVQCKTVLEDKTLSCNLSSELTSKEQSEPEITGRNLQAPGKETDQSPDVSVERPVSSSECLGTGSFENGGIETSHSSGDVTAVEPLQSEESDSTSCADKGKEKVENLMQPLSHVVLAPETASVRDAKSTDNCTSAPTSEKTIFMPCHCESDNDPNCPRRHSENKDKFQEFSESVSGHSVQASTVPTQAVSDRESEERDISSLPQHSKSGGQLPSQEQEVQGNENLGIVQQVIEGIIQQVCEKSLHTHPLTCTDASREGQAASTVDGYPKSGDSENTSILRAKSHEPNPESQEVMDRLEMSQESSAQAFLTEKRMPVCVNVGERSVEVEQDQSTRARSASDVSGHVESIPRENFVSQNEGSGDIAHGSGGAAAEEDKMDMTEDHQTEAVTTTCVADDVEMVDGSHTEDTPVVNQPQVDEKDGSFAQGGVQNAAMTVTDSLEMRNETAATTKAAGEVNGGSEVQEDKTTVLQGSDVEVSAVSADAPCKALNHKEGLNGDEEPEKSADHETNTANVTAPMASHGVCPSLLIKPAEHSFQASKVAEAKPTDLNPISLKEVEYLCKGLTHYVRRDLRCPHVTDRSSKSEASTLSDDTLVSNAMGQNRLIGALDLAGKKDKSGETDTMCNILKRSSSDLQKVLTEADLKTVESGAREGMEIQNSGTKSSQKKESDLTSNSCVPGGQDKPAVHTNLFQEDQSSQSSIQSSKNDLDSRNPDYSDSDSELLDLMIELELRKHRERDAIDQDAEQACEDCLRRHKHSILLEAPAKWSAEDFEKIRFGKHGKNGLVYSVCSMCHRYYGGVDFLIRHQWKKHPSIQCSHMDVELGHNLETLFYLQPSTHGILAQSVLLPPEHLNLDTYTCTRCKTSFKQYNRLRAHILNCDPNAPTPPHVRRKKLKQRNRHRFMEKMFSGPSTASSELKYQGKEASLPRKDHTSSSGGKQLGQTAVSKMHSQGSSGKYQLTGSSSKNSVRTPSTNSSRSSTPTKMKSGHNREMMSPSRMSNYSPSSQGSLSPTTGRGRKRRNYELLYNPAAHVRRRETAECLEVHQCRGCGLRCKTLSLLERHARKCSGKEKLQSQRPVMNRFLEAAGSKKHPCHYCPKRFTYLKGVANHYRNNFCRMRLERIARGGLSAEDLKHEADLAESILRQAWNKTENRDHTDVIQGRAHLHDDGTITTTRRRGGWPKGVKRGNKRRRHGWTYIKRRKTDGNGSGESKDGGDGSVSGSVDDDQSGHNTPSTVASTPASSPGSATHAVMSELEARLREPVVKGGAKKMQQGSRQKPLEFSEPFPGSQIARHSDPARKRQAESSKQDTHKMKKSSQSSGSQKHKGKVDQSDLPVIDKMPSDGSPKNERFSPDPEPPTLSPVTPFAPSLGSAQSTENPDDCSSRRSRRKRKARNLKGYEGELLEDLSGSTDAKSTAHSDGKSPKLDSKMVEQTGRAQAGKGGTLSRLAKDMGKAGTMQHFKLYQLKIPNVMQRSAITTVSGSHADEGDKPSTGDFSVTKDPPKPLPPNFLFPPPDPDQMESKDSETTPSELVSFLQAKTVGIPGPKTDKKNKAKGEKNATEPLTVDTTLPTTINNIFKSRKSPQSAANANTLKKIGAYRLEKPSAASATATTASVSHGKPTPAFTPLIPVSSMSMLPPGAMVAVLPTSPILLQTVPSTLSKTPLSSTPPAKVSLATSSALQTAVAEGKVLIALDARNLQMCLSSASIPITNQQPVTSSMKTGTVSVSSKAKAASQHKVNTKSPAPEVKTSAAADKTTTGLSSSLPRPKIDVPNFLFDSKQEKDTDAISKPESAVIPDKEKQTQDSSSVEDCSTVPLTEEKAAAEVKSLKRLKKKPKRGPPPHSPSPGNRIKSMVMMTAPGVHTMLSLDVPTSPNKLSLSPPLPKDKKTPPARKLPKEKRLLPSSDTLGTAGESAAISPAALEEKTDSFGSADESAAISVAAPEEKKDLPSSSRSDSPSDDDVPLSEVAAKVKNCSP
ncbi:hypothetical protein BaRGS_00026227 [Batillaria attramentaria]|uniref:Uncharacterized protein n=1 Tax=Batillaria attramentaria TaxID=370345 RepID=A0ABD0K6C5_9CAEN